MTLIKTTDEYFFEFAIKIGEIKFDTRDGLIELQKLSNKYARMADSAMFKRLQIEIGRGD